MPPERISNSGSCPVPTSVNMSGFDIVDRIRTLALRVGVIKSFKGYMPSINTVANLASSNLRSQLQSSGISLIDVSGRQDIADKMVIGQSPLRLCCTVYWLC